MTKKTPAKPSTAKAAAKAAESCAQLNETQLDQAKGGITLSDILVSKYSDKGSASLFN